MRHNPAYSCAVFFIFDVNKETIYQFIHRLTDKGRDLYEYCWETVWRDPRDHWYVKFVKIINLSVRSFFDRNTQMLAGSLTYTTLLAVIPALSLLLAIAKGFGLQNMLIKELYTIFPAQQTMLETSFQYVDRFLQTLTQGVFVGIGIVFLLWTLVSLLRKIESVYNHVWNVRKGRSLYRTVTDYTAIMLILPILLICSSGLSIYISGLARSAAVGVLSPIVKFLINISPACLLGVVFVGMNVLIPYTKVKVKNAIIPGLVCGIIFYLIQYAFVHGQIYVTKYNAIYGGVAFLPLFLIWLQLSWTVCIACAVITYSAQNFYRFNYVHQVDSASIRYLDQIALYVMAEVIRRFDRGEKAFGKKDFAEQKQLPIKLVNIVIDKLSDGGFLSTIIDDDANTLYQPSSNLTDLTVGEFILRYHEIGYSDFIEDGTLVSDLAELQYIIENNRQMPVSRIPDNAIIPAE